MPSRNFLTLALHGSVYDPVMVLARIAPVRLQFTQIEPNHFAFLHDGHVAGEISAAGSMQQTRPWHMVL